MSRAKVVSEDAVRFGAIINRLRTEHRWTLEDLARFSRMNSTYLGVLERGLNMPTLATILEVAEVFGVDAAEIVPNWKPREERCAPRTHDPRSGKTCASETRIFT